MGGTGDRKYLLVADAVRGQLNSGLLRPGQAVPGARELRRETGYTEQTCLHGLRFLVMSGVLVKDPGRTGRYRVPRPGMPRAAGALEAAKEILSAGLKVRREARMISREELAVLADVPVTAVEHAETMFLWQRPGFWEAVDVALGAFGELVSLYEGYLRARAAAAAEEAVPPGEVLTPRETEIAVLFAGGMACDAIAVELHVARWAVRTHLSSIHAKAGTRAGAASRARLAAWLEQQVTTRQRTGLGSAHVEVPAAS